MARMCNSCNSAFDDTVMYCPNCGSRTDKLQAAQNVATNSGQSRDSNFMEWSLLLVMLLGVYIFWAVNWEWGAIFSIGVFITPYVDKRGIKYKATGMTKVLAIVHIVLSVIFLFI